MNYKLLLFLSVTLLYTPFLKVNSNPPNITRLFNPTQVSGNYENLYINHSKINHGEVYVSAFTSDDFFGYPAVNDARYIAKLGIDGLPLWSAKFSSVNNYTSLNLQNDFAQVDQDDNLIMYFTTNGANSTLEDAEGTTVNFNSYETGVVAKMDKDGKLIWAKEVFYSGSMSSLILNKEGDIFVLTDSGIPNYTENIPISGFSFIKLDGNTGALILAKSYDFSVFSVLPMFDNQGNLYVFTEPINDDNSDFYILDGVEVKKNKSGDNILLKFDENGNCTWGKNFHHNGEEGEFDYTWLTSAKFDGTNFVVSGVYYSAMDSEYFTGLDDVQVPKEYQDAYLNYFIAKISPSGQVIWENPIYAEVSGLGNYTNIELDENNDFYAIYNLQKQIKYRDVEYNLPENQTGVLLKFLNNGELSYTKNIAESNGYSMIDVFGKDQFNFGFYTTSANLLGYPITNTNEDKMVFGTIGELANNYLSPQDNYSEVEELEIPNYENENNNSVSFLLINNVAWEIEAEEDWISISSVPLSESVTDRPDYSNRTDMAQTNSSVSGSNDSEINLFAKANYTSTTRTAILTISGNGVAEKKILISQSGVLGMEPFKKSMLSIYPNPVVNILNIESITEIESVEGFTITGAKIFSEIHPQSSQFDVSSLSSGTYIFRITSKGGKVESFKVIKN